MPCGCADPRPGIVEPVSEERTIIGYRWWRPDELQACGAATTPGLLRLMRAAIGHLDRRRAC
jgi:hypothetical protein